MSAGESNKDASAGATSSASSSALQEDLQQLLQKHFASGEVPEHLRTMMQEIEKKEVEVPEPAVLRKQAHLLAKVNKQLKRAQNRAYKEIIT